MPEWRADASEHTTYYSVLLKYMLDRRRSSSLQAAAELTLRV
jgi:hypothetical protein